MAQSHRQQGAQQTEKKSCGKEREEESRYEKVKNTDLKGKGPLVGKDYDGNMAGRDVGEAARPGC